MPAFRTLLVPTDFSTCAEQAFTYALDLARRLGASLRLLHVIGPVEGDAWSPLHYMSATGQERLSPDQIVYRHLCALIDAHNTEGVRVEPDTRHGAAVGQTILQYAADQDVDLIVLGTHGHSAVQRLFMGSVTARILRHAPCAVLTLREAREADMEKNTSAVEPGPASIRRILIPVDLSDASEPLLRTAHELAETYDAQMDLLYVIEPLPFMGLLSGVMTTEDLLGDVGRRADEMIRELVAQVNGEGIPIKRHVEEGHAEACIVDFAARCGIDLIVIASHGRSGTEFVVLGSVTERVVRAAPCPVLTVRVTADGASPQAEEERAATSDV